MLKVDPKPEPADFDAKVRLRGNAYLAGLPSMVGVKFKGKDYWRNAADDLRNAYGGICAYTSIYINEVTGSQTVEHFVPKVSDPTLAYEWTNYRLVCGRMNGRKRENTDVADPFKIPEELFHLHFPSLMMRVNGAMPNEWQDAGKKTIKRLGLNDHISIRSRTKVIRLLLSGDIKESYVAECYPFIHRELARQRIDMIALALLFAVP